MKKLSLLLVVAISLLLPQSNYAEVVTETNQDSIATKVSKIDAFVTKYKKIIENLPTLTAYTRIGYLTNENASTFSLNNVYIGFSGKFAKKFEYKFLADLANPRVLDATFTYKPFTQLNITVGQSKIPFTIGNSFSPLTEECIDVPLAIQRLVGYKDVCGIENGAGRDLGVTLSGSFFKQPQGYSRLEYSIAVVNGTGATTKDNNKSKDVVGRLNIYPTKEFLLSASAMYGEYGAEYVKRTRFSVGGSYSGKFLLIRAEGLYSKSTAFNSYGGYALFMGNITPKLAILTRLDLFSEKINTDMPVELYYTAGATYRPFKFLRLQANYTRRTYTNDSPFTAPNQFQVMVTGIF